MKVSSSGKRWDEHRMSIYIEDCRSSLLNRLISMRDDGIHVQETWVCNRYIITSTVNRHESVFMTIHIILDSINMMVKSVIFKSLPKVPVIVSDDVI